MTTQTGTLTLKTAIGGYGHFAALKDGSLKPDGVELEQIEVTPIISAFRRMCRTLEFDVSEMAITTYLCAKAYGLPFTAIPVFPVRAFHHAATVGNTDAGVRSPKDLEGKKVGVRAYTVTTGVWARGILQNEYGVDLSKVTWVLADEEHVEQFHKDAPSNTSYQIGADLGKMLTSGEIQGGIGMGRLEAPNVKPVIADASAAAAAMYRRLGASPINHTVVVKDELLAKHPQLAGSLYRAFSAAKERWLASASDADKATAGGNIVEGDPYPYGLEKNHKAMETIIEYAVQQKILPRSVAVEELFAKGSE